jgi:hypothetical protein
VVNSKTKRRLLVCTKTAIPIRTRNGADEDPGTHDEHASRRKPSNEEDEEDEDGDENGDEDADNECEASDNTDDEQDLDDEDEDSEAMDDDEILEKEGFADL